MPQSASDNERSTALSVECYVQKFISWNLQLGTVQLGLYSSLGQFFMEELLLIST